MGWSAARLPRRGAAHVRLTTITSGADTSDWQTSLPLVRAVRAVRWLPTEHLSSDAMAISWEMTSPNYGTLPNS